MTFSVFLFGMYARYPIRDPFYLVSILSFSGARKVHSSGVSRFRAFPLFRRVRVYHLLLSLSFSLFIYPPSLSLLLLTLPSPDCSLFLKFLALRYFAGGRSSKIRYARFPPITHVNSARSSRAENRKIVGPGKRLWPLLVGARRPPSQTIFR